LFGLWGTISGMPEARNPLMLRYFQLCCWYCRCTKSGVQLSQSNHRAALLAPLALLILYALYVWSSQGPSLPMSA
jgi:hypothetical protein